METTEPNQSELAISEATTISLESFESLGIRIKTEASEELFNIIEIVPDPAECDDDELIDVETTDECTESTLSAREDLLNVSTDLAEDEGTSQADSTDDPECPGLDELEAYDDSIIQDCIALECQKYDLADLDMEPPVLENETGSIDTQHTTAFDCTSDDFDIFSRERVSEKEVDFSEIYASEGLENGSKLPSAFGGWIEQRKQERE